MGDRMDEAKGNVKQGVGKVTGNPDMEAEGKTEHDSAAAKRQVKGAANQVKGSVKEGLGKVTGDEETRARGTADKLKGDAQRTG
ncbi:MAG: CsbD family protein [Chloroflexi bacterium]|nr:CsbD family protein [Chloroflexota bacterium]MBV9599312.1 CsbD family protein [Chloroflexota bacterium]